MVLQRPINLLLVAAALSTVVLIVSACTSSAPTPATQSSSTAGPVATLAPSRTVAPEATSAPTHTSTPSGPFPVGDYRAVNPLYSSGIEFFQDRTFTIPDLGTKGTYTVTGDRIVLSETKGECAGVPGTYLWTFDGKTLTLKAVDDKCTHPRKQDLDRAWTRQP